MKKVFREIMCIITPLAFIYITGIFITLNFNPVKWSIFNDEAGRFCFLVIITVLELFSHLAWPRNK